MTAPIRLGILRLADSAPAVLAEAEGLFAAEGLDVTLGIEPSWANVADKLAWGGLDAAIMLLPLALAMAAGLRGPPAYPRVPTGISRGGNAIVVGAAAAARMPAHPLDAATAAVAFAAWLHDQPRPPRFAVVHTFSMHNLLLRSWLSAGGMDPDTDLRIIVLPPDRVVEALRAGEIAGFCAGAPWGDHAAELGAGRVLIGGSAIRAGHIEKCLALSAAFGAERADAATRLARALSAARRRCGEAAHADSLARLLADRLDLPQHATRAALPGGSGIERIDFTGPAEIAPAETEWCLAEMRRWGWLADDATVARFSGSSLV